MYVALNRAGGPDADEGCRPDGGQLFDGNGRGRRADAGGADRNGAAVERPRVGRVLAVAGDQAGAVEQPGDRLHPAGIAGEKHNLADVARFAADVVLQIPHSRREFSAIATIPTLARKPGRDSPVLLAPGVASGDVGLAQKDDTQW